MRGEFCLFGFCSDSEKHECAKLGIAFMRIPKDAKEGRREKLKKQVRKKSPLCFFLSPQKNLSTGMLKFFETLTLLSGDKLS